MLLAFHCHDTAAILSTHGLPGLLGWFAHLILQIKDCGDHTVYECIFILTDTEDMWHLGNLTSIF